MKVIGSNEASHWKEIGLKMNLPKNVLENINTNEVTNDAKLRQVCTQWLKQKAVIQTEKSDLSDNLRVKSFPHLLMQESMSHMLDTRNQLSKFSETTDRMVRAFPSKVDHFFPLAHTKITDSAVLATLTPTILNILLIRPLEFDSQCLKAISPKIELSKTHRKQTIVTIPDISINPYHKIVIHDFITSQGTTWKDIQKLAVSSNDIVLFCTPLLNNSKSQDKQKVQAHDSAAISFLSKSITSGKEQFWSKTLFVLSKGYLKDETSKQLKSKINARLVFLKNRVETASHNIKHYKMKYVIVNDNSFPISHQSNSWKENLIHTMITSCESQKAIQVLEHCLKSLT